MRKAGPPSTETVIRSRSGATRAFLKVGTVRPSASSISIVSRIRAAFLDPQQCLCLGVVDVHGLPVTESRFAFDLEHTPTFIVFDPIVITDRNPTADASGSGPRCRLAAR